jgi:LemA protein
MSLIIVTAIVIVFSAWFVLIYNKFIKIINRAKEALADIDVQLKRRYDLIPNLVNTVKGYSGYEASTLEAVITARNSALQAVEDHASLEERAQKENMISESLKSIFALTENYPDLKANQGFIELQKELTDTENKIQAARRFYNGNVRDLITHIETFPSNIIAKIFAFARMSYFEVAENEKEAIKAPVEVKF